MYNLYLLNYKNYYNRQVKRLPNLSDYLIDDYLLYTLQNINFKPDNWVNTKQIVNVDVTPNYLIAEDLDDGSFTRWFVIESNKLRNGQYSLSLLRDVICDELKDVLTSMTYVEKGYIEDINPLVLNEEQFTCNQIKQKEIQLYDKTGISWLMLYFSSNTEYKQVEIPKLSAYKSVSEEITADNLEYGLAILNQSLYNYYNKNIVFEGSTPNNFIKVDYDSFINIYNRYNGYYFELKTLNEDTQTYSSTIYKIFFEKFWDIYSGNSFREIYRMYVNDVTNLFKNKYKLTVPATKEGYIQFFPFSDLVLDTNYLIDLCKNIQLQLGEKIILDAQILPYNPYCSSGVDRYIENYDFESIDNYNKSAYFGTVSSLLGENDEDFNIYGVGSQLYNNFKKRSFEITIPNYFKKVNNMLFKTSKLQKSLQKHRLCSPNFNGGFDFNFADMLNNENNNYVTFTIDLDYKPYIPYIKISPKFSGLYGKDFNDARGLICGGEFSVDQASSEWANYQLNNKNYENQFNREIENMETNRKYDRIDNIAGAIGGVATGAASGAIVGGLPGAIVGGVVSAAAGVVDIIVNDLQYNKTLDYTKDMYNYSLQNIQAIPYSLTKVSPYNGNNKNVPFIELYTCTEQELEAFKNKIRYNGMTINVLGNLKDYILNDESEETYVKGKLVRINDLKDYYFGRILSNEVNQGFFIKPSDYEDLDF